MVEEMLILTDEQHVDVHVYIWLPDANVKLRGIVQIAHGMAESAIRYRRFAQSLTQAGYGVYASDHRGHGLTAGQASEIGRIGKDGFTWIVRDMYQLTAHVRSVHPELPIIVFGHSMGSFALQQYVGCYGDAIDGVILSGSNGKQSGWLLGPGIALAAAISFIRGDRHRSPLLHTLTLGPYNRFFRPNRTKSDWLSSDEREVDKYVKGDVHSGVMFSAGFFRDFYKALRAIHKPEHLAKVPQELPIYLFAGDKDPVGEQGKGFRRLEQMYRTLGVKDVTARLYPGRRHEMLNEINRDEVTADVLAWLNARVESWSRQRGK